MEGDFLVKPLINSLFIKYEKPLQLDSLLLPYDTALLLQDKLAYQQMQETKLSSIHEVEPKISLTIDEYWLENCPADFADFNNAKQGLDIVTMRQKLI